MHTYISLIEMISGNRDVKFLECDYLLLQLCVKLTLVANILLSNLYTVNGMHLIRCTLNDIGHSGIYPERKKNLKPILMDLTMGSKSALIQIVCKLIVCKNFKIQKFLNAICWRLKYRKYRKKNIFWLFSMFQDSYNFTINKIHI